MNAAINADEYKPEVESVRTNKIVDYLYKMPFTDQTDIITLLEIQEGIQTHEVELAEINKEIGYNLNGTEYTRRQYGVVMYVDQHNLLDASYSVVSNRMESEELEVSYPTVRKTMQKMREAQDDDETSSSSTEKELRELSDTLEELKDDDEIQAEPVLDAAIEEIRNIADA